MHVHVHVHAHVHVQHPVHGPAALRRLLGPETRSTCDGRFVCVVKGEEGGLQQLGETNRDPGLTCAPELPKLKGAWLCSIRARGTHAHCLPSRRCGGRVLWCCQALPPVAAHTAGLSAHPCVCTHGCLQVFAVVLPACMSVFRGTVHRPACIHKQTTCLVFRPIYIVAAASSNHKGSRAGWGCGALPHTPVSPAPFTYRFSPHAQPRGLNLCLLLFWVCVCVDAFRSSAGGSPTLGGPHRACRESCLALTFCYVARVEACWVWYGGCGWRLLAGHMTAVCCVHAHSVPPVWV
jgi:hypothetical protein